MPLYKAASEFAKPTPDWIFNAPPDDSIARFAAGRNLGRVIASLIVEHGHKRIIPYDGPAPAAAKRTAALAARHGFTVIERETPIGHAVEGLHEARGVGFRAYWERGKTAGGTWHTKGRDVWKLIDISDRPIGVDARTKTTKVGHRHDVNDRTQLVIVASPRGLHYGITEIERKIAS